MSFQCLASWSSDTQGETYMSLLDTKLPQLGEEARPRYRCAVSYQSRILTSRFFSRPSRQTSQTRFAPRHAFYPAELAIAKFLASKGARRSARGGIVKNDFLRLRFKGRREGAGGQWFSSQPQMWSFLVVDIPFDWTARLHSIIWDWEPLPHCSDHCLHLSGRNYSTRLTSSSSSSAPCVETLCPYTTRVGHAAKIGLAAAAAAVTRANGWQRKHT